MEFADFVFTHHHHLLHIQRDGVREREREIHLKKNTDFLSSTLYLCLFSIIPLNRSLLLLCVVPLTHLVKIRFNGLTKKFPFFVSKHDPQERERERERIIINQKCFCLFLRKRLKTILNPFLR